MKTKHHCTYLYSGAALSLAIPIVGRAAFPKCHTQQQPSIYSVGTPERSPYHAETMTFMIVSDEMGNINTYHMFSL